MFSGQIDEVMPSEATNQTPLSTPIVVSSQVDDNDQSSPTLNPSSQLPSIYNIEWSDVNSLELDFHVYKSLPNIRKQLNADECYNMEKLPRGICLIINNEHFYDQNGDEICNMRRYGTDMDASRLKSLFEKLNFNVELCVDLNEVDMRLKINTFAEDLDSKSKDFDAICLIILSHGTDGYVYGVDYQNRISVSHLI